MAAPVDEFAGFLPVEQDEFAGFLPAQPAAVKKQPIPLELQNRPAIFNELPDLPGTKPQTPDRSPIDSVAKYARNVGAAITPDLLDVGGLVEGGTKLATGAVAPTIASAIGIATNKEPTNADVERFTYEPRRPEGNALPNLIGAAAQPLADSGADLALLPLVPEVSAIGLQPRAPKAAPPRPPKALSTSELKAATDEAYAQARQAGITYPAAKVSEFKQQLAADPRLGSPNLQGLSPQAADALKYVQEAGGDLTLVQLEELRQIATSKAQAAPPGSDAALYARQLKQRIDDFIHNPQNATAADVAALEKLREGRALHAQRKKSQELETAKRDADLAEGDKGVALRSELRSIATNDKKRAGYSPEEIAAIEKTVSPTTTQHLLRSTGRLANPFTVASGVLSPLAAIGALAKKADTALTAKAFNEALRRVQTKVKPTAPLPKRETYPAPVNRPAVLPNESSGLSLVPDALATDLSKAPGAPAALTEAQRLQLAEQLAGDLGLEPSPQQARAADLAGDLTADTPLTVEGGLPTERAPFDYGSDRLPPAGAGVPAAPVGSAVGRGDEMLRTAPDLAGDLIDAPELLAQPAPSRARQVQPLPQGLGDEFLDDPAVRAALEVLQSKGLL